MNQFNLSDISLSIYSFGYSAGFLIDNRETAKPYQCLTPKAIAIISKELGLGGIEIPLDKYFPNPVNDNLEGFINEMNALGIRLVFDLENFTSNYLRRISSFLADYDSKFIRTKISRFYGGNRYKHPVYLEDKKEFFKNMDESLEILDDLGLKILVENHQDIVVNDIYDLLEKYGQDRIGVNWDIGNSFPSCETPDSFFEKLGKYIGNVHLKDYKLFSCKEGYIMSRCQLGKGVIDFDKVLKLLSNHSNIPLTIELGAFNSRVAEINNPDYWNHSPGISPNERDHFIKYINENSSIEGGWKTPWEMGSTPEELSSIELNEIKNSVNYISKLINERP